MNLASSNLISRASELNLDAFVSAFENTREATERSIEKQRNPEMHLDDEPTGEPEANAELEFIPESATKQNDGDDTGKESTAAPKPAKRAQPKKDKPIIRDSKTNYVRTNLKRKYGSHSMGRRRRRLEYKTKLRMKS